jgi:hypothetical protein
MIRISLVRTVAALAAAAALAAGEARAQGGLVGLGVGMGNVRDQSLDQQRVSPIVHARAGLSLSSRTTLMLEGAYHGIGDDQPRVDDVILIGAPSVDGPTALQFIRRPKILGTFSLVASLQVELPGELYVRPGAGLGWHSFPVYELGSDAPMVDVSEEAGPAVQLAIGRTVRVSPRLPIAVEAVGLWTQGEDSTGARWAAGIQVVPMIRF